MTVVWIAPGMVEAGRWEEGDSLIPVKYVYFVADTKGSLSTIQLKGVEDARIECARKFFAEINQKFDGQVKDDFADSYSTPMELVTG